MHPVLFHIGKFPIRSYGTLLVTGFMLGLWRAVRVADHRWRTEPEGSPRRIHPDNVFDLGIYGLLVALVGARLLFVLLDWGEYARRPIDIVKLWAGGLSLHGALLFGILYLIYFCRKRKISVLALGDLCAPSWAIGYAVGRIGCLLNGCCYGAACSLPWAVRFPDERHPGHLTPPSHPTQLYATLFNLFFFFVLRWWEQRPRRDGELFYGYIAMYGFYRFIVEMFRMGATSTYRIPSLHLTDTHLVSIAMFALGIGAIVWLRRHRPAVALAPAGAEALPAKVALQPQQGNPTTK
ncbi:MAG TPA: prolipoprotein diacylglyceryl transferase [Chthonomonadales bacterium]|nr:prolipoprotein diacylglyceryl transferase [Chthonomonadales bacterium]